MPKLTTVAVIDMGSNSFRLQVSEVIDGAYKVIEDYKEVLRIGDGVYKTGAFSQSAQDKIISTLKRMKVIMDNNKVTAARFIGTAPFRDASNTAEVIERVHRELGFNIEVISGEEEARLIFLAATGFFDMSGSHMLFVDIGGGSTELSYASDGNLLTSVSTDLGCGRLTQLYARKNKAKPEDIAKMKKVIDKTLLQTTDFGNVDRIVFTGGTVNSIAQVHARRSNLQDSVVKYVDATFLNHFVNELSGKNYEDRAKIPGLEPERADLSLAAALVVQALLKKFNLTGFFTFSGGLRNGLTIDLLNKMGIKLIFQNQKVPDVRYSKLVETGRKYNYEEEHAMQVTAISRILFNYLKKELNLKDKDWLLLEAAGVLHDIGQHISYSEHHKHSYYLIKNTELLGYTESEQDMIANIARYHRRSIPKNKHDNFNALAAPTQEKIEKLAAILRVADGLDRSHTSILDDLQLQITPKQITILLDTDKDAEMEIAGANKKKDLLEQVTGKKVVVK